MFATLRRKAEIYWAMGAIVPKTFLAYRAWFWIGMILNVLAMTIYVFFWRAVYAGTQNIAGLDLQQTLNYILLAQVFLPLTDAFLLFEFGYTLREGGIAMVLLRPVDLQASYYVQYLTHLAFNLLYQIPLAIIATLFFGLTWPTDPAVWGAFLVAVFLSRTVLFFFDWLLASLTFYTTEVWGLAVLITGVSMFASGSMLPLVMLPEWLKNIVQALPFAQVLYAPLSLLTGIVPVQDAPYVWGVQLAWIVGLAVISRLFFGIAVRKVTVQGG